MFIYLLKYNNYYFIQINFNLLNLKIYILNQKFYDFDFFRFVNQWSGSYHFC